MRWFVEVASLGGATEAKWTVEAPSWQSALAQARASRGDSAPLSSFAIELLADGGRAINALARQRWSVVKAPDDAPLDDLKAPAPPSTTAPATTDPTTTPSSPPPANRPSAPPRPLSEPPRANPQPPAARRPARTMALGSSGDIIAQVEAVGAPAPTAVAPASPAVAPPRPSATSSPSVPRVPAPAKEAPSSPSAPRIPSPAKEAPSSPRVAAAPAAAPSAPRVAAVGTAEHGTIFHRRAVEPGNRSPLTYREIAVALPHADRARALAAAHRHLDAIRAELDLANAPTGRLVHLAVFERAWSERPDRPPIVAIVWKDWKPEPEVQYPASQAAARASSASLPAANVPAPIAPIAPIAPVITEASTSASVAAVGAPPTVASVAASKPRAVDTRTLAAEISSAAEAARPSQRKADALPNAIEAIVAAPAAPLRALQRTDTAGATKRPRPDDLMSEIFESLHDLQFLRDSLEGADFVLELLREKLPTRVTMIHLYDINTKEFVVVRARAPNVGVVGTRTFESVGLVAAAVKSGKPILVADAASDARWARERYAAAGYEPRSILIAPVRHGQRYVGAIELADHVDGAPFGETEEHALAYVAEQLGEFVDARGITIDRNRHDQSGGYATIDARDNARRR